MTSSINFKKLVSVGAALLLAVGGSLISGSAAQATAGDHTNFTLQGGSAHIQSGMTSISIGDSGCGGITGTPNLSDFVLTINGTVTTPAGIQAGSFIVLSLSNPVASGDSLSLAYTQNGVRLLTCGLGGQIGSFTFTDTAPIVTSLTGNSGNVTGSVGTALSMNTHVTSGLTTPIVYSYAVQGGLPLPSGITFSTSTGLFTGTPTSAATNMMITITATGANALTATESFNLTITGGGGGGGGSYTITSPASYSISNNVATANDGVWTGGTTTRWWILCNNPHTSPSTSIHMDCYPMSLTQNGTDERGTTVNLATTVWMGFSGNRTLVNFADKYFGLYVQNNGAQYVTATSAGPAPSATTAPALTPEQARNQIKPLPVIVQPLVAALPALNKPLVDAGGKVDLKSGDFTGLVSASISGKTIDLTVGSTGSLTITVPNGKAGTTADLLLNFKTGTVILQDAIKYVAPVVVAQVPVRPVSIKAGAKKLSETAADEIRHAAFANLKNNSIECVAYAASAATADAAKATAQQACDLAVKSNPDLVNTSVVVVIDKIKAATQGVGIRVYKQ